MILQKFGLEELEEKEQLYAMLRYVFHGGENIDLLKIDYKKKP